MIDINDVFFELIQVSLGNRVCLSRTPSEGEWSNLFEMSMKQSLVGICFVGVQHLQKQNLPELLYLKWMGLAAKIQQRNEVLNRQCIELQRSLATEGFCSAILKGQGIGALYGDLSRLRQSGDIDVWIPNGIEASMRWIEINYGKVEFDYINAHVPCFSDTEVELHWRVQALSNLFLNKKLQRWLGQEKVKEMVMKGKATLKFSEHTENNAHIVTPSAEFNAFYILLHCYHHMFECGLGLRQLMDYYFVLRDVQTKNFDDFNVSEFHVLLRQFGMMRFAKGVMWVVAHIFASYDDTPNFYLGIEPNEKEGRFLLNEVMQGGNFGHHDERITKMSKDSRWQSVWSQLQHSLGLAAHYPSNMFWQPVWVVYHYFWKRTAARRWMR